MSGAVTHNSVNVDEARTVGNAIMASMTGCSVESFSLRKRDKAITMADKTAVKIDNKEVIIDSQLLFQHIVSCAQCIGDDIAPVLKYELCSQPPALFDNDGLMRKAVKSALADAIWKLCEMKYYYPQVKALT